MYAYMHVCTFECMYACVIELGWGRVCYRFVSPTYGPRTFPQILPAYLVVLDSTLGARQGTLYLAPRDSERLTKDANVWTKGDLWNDLACKATAPLPTSFLLKQFQQKVGVFQETLKHIRELGSFCS